MPTETGKIYHLKEKIRKANLEVTLNKTVNRPRYHVSVGLCRDHKVYKISVSKLVYYLFIRPFNLKDPNILITPKDNDGRNTHVSNLKMADFETIIKKSYKIGRTKNFTPIPVTQFDHNGKPIGYYSSAEEASKKTGLVRRSISKAAQRKITLYKNCFWRIGIHKRKLNLRPNSKEAQLII